VGRLKEALNEKNSEKLYSQRKGSKRVSVNRGWGAAYRIDKAKSLVLVAIPGPVEGALDAGVRVCGHGGGVDVVVELGKVMDPGQVLRGMSHIIMGGDVKVLKRANIVFVEKITFSVWIYSINRLAR